MMALLWLLQRRTGDAGVVDLGWSVGVGGSALLMATLASAPWELRLALVAAACPWSVRLASYLLLDRVAGKEEDGRYKALRARWGENAQRNFFLFFQAQALFVVIFTLPFCFVIVSGQFGVATLVGLVIAWLAIAGESIADAQLRRWRANPENKGKTCRSGLWRFSRHPNYFFEWLHWWSYVAMCWGASAMLGALLGPAIMLLFLFRLTGIPYTEAQALRSRGDDYRAYQRTTSVFIPWFPKKGTE